MRRVGTAAAVVLAAVGLLVSLVFLVGPPETLADKGGCPNAASANGAAHANERSAHGPEKQAARGCGVQATPTEGPGETPSPAPTGEMTPTPTPSGGPTETPGPSLAPTPTPTSTPTHEPTPTGTPLPTPTLGPGGPTSWGDVDCDGGIQQLDVEAISKYINTQPVPQVEPCPDIGSRATFVGFPVSWIWGDIDCTGSIEVDDAVKLATWIGGGPVVQNEPCPDIGMPLTLAP